MSRTRRRHDRRGVTVQLPLGLLDTPTVPGTASAWAALDEEHRTLVVATLARLIAKLAAAQRTIPRNGDKETHHA
jgi:hypothetical protein